MKVLIILSILLVATASADQDSSSSTSTTSSSSEISSEESKCETELKRIRSEVRTCVNDYTFNFLTINWKLKKLNDRKITEDEFITFIDDFCPKALNATRCTLEKIPTISGECQTDDKVKIKTNMVRFYNTKFEHLCQDDAKGYKDIIKNHGTECFMENSDLNECWKTHGLRYMAKNNFKEENICKFIKVATDCQEHLSKCDNPDVKTISIELHALFKEKFHCQDQ